MIDNKAILQEYVECKAVIKEAEERMKELAEEIKCFAEVDQVYELDTAKVSYVQGKPKYIYSPETTEKEKALKEIQKMEVQTGVAEITHGEPFLMVKFNK
jgi:hypothetical protein